MMKVTSEKATPKFIPFEIRIRFESLEEVEKWWSLLSFNVIIPEQVMELSGIEAKELSRQMSSIQCELQKNL